MNSIPITFSGSLPSYTVVGGKNRNASTGLSAVVLYRGNRTSRFVMFEELGKQGFDYVISLETGIRHHDIEGLSDSFPFVRFLFIKELLSPGEEINIAARELSSPLFFVLWNDLRIIRSGGAERIAEKIFLSPKEMVKNPERQSPIARLCTVPVIQNKRFETMPTLASPAMIKGKFRTLHSVPSREAQFSVYPFDGLGIYDRERFIRLGGFDNSIKNFHWQLLDFGFRSFLWGEEIAAVQTLRLAYEQEAPEEDSSADENYRRFFLKNLAPVFRGEYANIPLRRFPKYLLRSRRGVFAAWQEFAEARRWIDSNCRCFRTDGRLLIDTWKYSDEEAR
ncbi:MAG: hypothetical protein LBH43_10410 [Treponema sp.]|jgi:hypothetical protein|nr:hypothetical protein [Treponema sp.]